MQTAFRLEFDGILVKMKRKFNKSVTHFDILKYIGDQCQEMMQFFNSIEEKP